MESNNITLEYLLKKWEDFVANPLDISEVEDITEEENNSDNDFVIDTVSTWYTNCARHLQSDQWTPMRSVGAITYQRNISLYYVAKPFIRFKLNHKLFNNNIYSGISNSYLINNILSNINGIISISDRNGKCLYTVPLNFVMLMNTLLSYNMTTINVKEFKKLYSPEEISRILITEYKKFAVMNEKYNFENDNDIYFDIPLLMDCFTYSAPISFRLHNFKTEIYLSPPSELLVGIKLMFEEIYTNDQFKPHQSYKCINIDESLLFKIKAASIIHRISCFSDMDDVNKMTHLFIKLEIPKLYNIDSNYICKLPVIESIAIHYRTTNIDINMSNVLYTLYDTHALYCVCIDNTYDMKNWINTMQNNINYNKQRILSETYDNDYPIENKTTKSINIGKRIKYFNVSINFSPYDIPINISFFTMYTKKVE